MATYRMSPSGADSNPGTLALPWRSLHASVNKLLPGDTLNLRGGIYDGLNGGISGATACVMTVGGTSGARVTIQSEPGERAVLKGWQDISGGWVNVGGNVWRKTFTRPGGLAANGDSIDPASMSTVPDNAAASGDQWGVCFVDDALTSNNWLRPYGVLNGEIASYNALPTGGFATDSPPMPQGTGTYAGRVTNIYVNLAHLADTNPNNHRMRVLTHLNAFHFWGSCDYITIKDIDFEGYEQFNYAWSRTTGLEIVNCHFQAIRARVVYGHFQATGVWVRGCTFEKFQYNCVHLESNDGGVEDCVMRDPIQGYGGYGTWYGAGGVEIAIGNRNLIRRNRTHDFPAQPSFPRPRNSGGHNTEGWDYNGTFQCDDNVFDGNLVYNIDGDGIVDIESARTIYRNNIFHDLAGRGIAYGVASHGGVTSHDARMLNNTFYQCGEAIHVYNIGRLADIRNNIFRNCGANVVVDSGGTTLNNSSNVTADPLFVDVGAGDFRTQAGSPARGAGVNLTSLGVTTDYAGSARPGSGAFEVGAYQSDASGPPPPPPTGGTIAVTTPLDLDLATVEPGQTIVGTVTYTVSGGGIRVNDFAIGMRPPGGTNGGGPYLDATITEVRKGGVVQPLTGPWDFAAADVLLITGARTILTSDPLGGWYAFAAHQNDAGAWVDAASGQDQPFTVQAPGTPPPVGGESFETAVVGVGALVGWWKLQETSGTNAADAATAPHVGTYRNTPALNQAVSLVPSESGRKSVLFDGVSEDVLIAHHADHDLTAGWSWQLCFRAPTAPPGGSSTSPSLVSHAGSKGVEYAAGNGLEVYTFTGGFQGEAHALALAANTRYLVFAEQDVTGGLIRIAIQAEAGAYDDGETLVVAGASLADASDLAIASYGGSSDFFAGHISDVILRSRPLTTAERQRITTAWKTGGGGSLTVPGSPQAVVAVAGNGQATVTWQAPANNGGSSITGYDLTTTPATATTSVGPLATSATVPGLTNGTFYTITVKAVNAQGASAGGVSNAVAPSGGPTRTLSGGATLPAPTGGGAGLRSRPWVLGLAEGSLVTIALDGAWLATVTLAAGGTLTVN